MPTSKGQARHPVLLEVNTRFWLRELATAPGKPGTLDQVPDAALDHIAGLGFNWLWPMGVWQSGTAGRALTLSQPQAIAELRQALPDLTDLDVCTSPFAVQSYSVHPDFGGERALKSLRSRLRERGMRLMLDFVPNHTALDHPWLAEHPEFYVHGQEVDLAREPANYIRIDTPHGPLILAHGRDPYFPGWPDTLQLNYRHAGLRQAMIGELSRIAGQCDGVRCDMAMLILPDVFARTWGDTARPADGTAPVDTPFWPQAIARVRREHPAFVLMAEAYWDLEWTLQQQGFDFTYDKRLYDSLRARDAGAVRGHLHADLDYQARSARFLDNHDEERAAAAFPPGIHQAAAIVAYFVPGLRFFYDAQLLGRKSRGSVLLARRLDEPTDEALRTFYVRLLECLKDAALHEGRWQLLDCRPAWEGNPTASRFIAFAWDGLDGQRLLITVNFGETQGQCYVGLPFADLRGRTVVLSDQMSPASYDKSGDDLLARGLYLDMPAWGFHVFEGLGTGARQ
ncbi:MAG TPA: alpha-amylase family glycosyl hydrolase [Isosphaeraceae bacterium]|jgi:hypothetical protein|nr:alpha-amylase family glycosyl hydrolase [Isosphaeraceae bacterium]